MQKQVQWPRRCRRARIPALGWCGCVILLAGPGVAQEVVEVPPVVVHSSPLDAFGLEATRTESLSMPEILTQRPIPYLPDVLEDSAGVGLQRTGPGQTSPYLRGFTGFRTLLVLDGFRFNNSAWRDGPNQYFMTVDSEAVSSVDVHYGTGGVRYGSDAVGGTVILESRAAGSWDPAREHSGLLSLRYATAERSIVTHAEVGGKLGERVLYHLGLTDRGYGDIVGGRHIGTQPNTSFHAGAGDAKLSFLLGDQSMLTLAHQVDRQNDVPRTHATVHGISWHGTTVGSDLRRDLDQERDFTYLRLQSLDLGFAERLRAGLGFHSQDETEQRVRSDQTRNHQGFDVNTLATFVNLESQVNFGALRYGVDAARDHVQSFRDDFNADGSLRSSRIQGPVADDAIYDLAGAFAEAEVELAERWIATLGVRLQYGASDADQVEDPATGNPIEVEDDWSDWTGELRLLRRMSESVEAYGAASRAVRLPNLSDLTRFDIARSGELETPSPGLDPEQFSSFELGLRRHSARLEMQAAVYWTHLQDMIVRYPTGVVIDGAAEVQKANAGDGQLYGVDLLGLVHFTPQWSLRGSAIFTAGRVEAFVSPSVQDDEPLSKVPPLHGNLALRWEDPDSSLWVEGIASMADDQDRLSSGDQLDTQRIPPGGTPGYTVLGIRTGFSPRKNVEVAAGVENLTDRDYRLHGSGVNEPGTNVVFSILWRF